MSKNKAYGLVLAFLAAPAVAGEADVVAVDVRADGGGTYTVSATVRHADEGWNHCADAFEVLAPDGTSLGVRTLLHPHVDEQPFIRSLSGVTVPAGVTEIVVRAHDSVHGNGGAELTVNLPDRTGS